MYQNTKTISRLKNETYGQRKRRGREEEGTSRADRIIVARDLK